MHVRHLLLATLVLTIPSLGSAQWSGEWKFDETSGTTAADISPNKHDGTLVNFPATPPWGPGQFKNALTFDGTDDYVDLKTGPGLPVYNGKGQPYSISLWVKGLPQNDKRVYAESSTQSNNPIVTFGTGRTSLTNEDKFQIYIRNDAGTTVCNGYSKATVFDDTWHHVAWVESSGQTAIYVDGKFDSSIPYTVPPGAANFGTWTMDVATAGGIRRAGLCCHFAGGIDDLRVYSYALDASDVALVYRNIPLVPRRGSVGYWGAGCNGTLTIWGAGNLAPGGAVNFSLSRGVPGAVAQIVLGAPLGELDLTSIGFPGCIAYPSLQGATFLSVGTLDPAGTVSPVTLPIPNIPALSGVLGVFQGLTLTPGNLSLSSAALLHIGG